ncbi:hypothetical protein ElyMa_000788800 [Elysia marginata]|uniref:Transmembrane protein n=1 Tax=Elysia marginata TaxID=1093978 RepID=A0AAV4GVC4_9GAST|nr:hypothetical protein ElyMa_000788800 [Elysia marginata]
MALTFALMAMLTAIVASTQSPWSRSRSRSPRQTKALSLRDSFALTLLGGQLANFAFGSIAVWTSELQGFLATTTCTSLIAVGVASQWNVALSTPTLALYYVLIIACLDQVFQPVNQRRGAERVRQNREELRDGHRAVHETGANGRLEGNHQNCGLINVANCLTWWRSSVGVLFLVGVVNVSTLVATHYSLSEVDHALAFNASAEEHLPLQSFCHRFFAFPELFPRRQMGVVFIVSAGITAAAILVLSRQLDRKGKRHRAVDTVRSGDAERLRSFTRPPNEGVHFHHYAAPSRLPASLRFGDGTNDEVGYNPTSLRAELVTTTQAGENRRLLSMGSDSAVEDVTSLDSTATQGPWSDHEFYDIERTRHLVQSPPPPDCSIRANSRRTAAVFLSETSLYSTSQEAMISPTGQNHHILYQPYFKETDRIGTQLPSQRAHSLDVASLDIQRSTNENARPQQLEINVQGAVQSSSSSNRADQVAPGANQQHAREERDVEGLWERLQQLRLVDLIFPHRHTGKNPKRFSHTKVEHVREEILPASSSRQHLTSIPSSTLTLSEVMTCHSVCVSGALFVLTYTIMAVYLLLTDNGWGVGNIVGRYRFIDSTFEPYLALLLVKAALDSFFCFAALVSLLPIFLKG